MIKKNKMLRKNNVEVKVQDIVEMEGDGRRERGNGEKQK